MRESAADPVIVSESSSPPGLRPGVVPPLLERRELLQPELLERLEVAGGIVDGLVGGGERVEDLEREGVYAALVPLFLQLSVAVEAVAELRPVAVEDGGQIDAGADQHLAVAGVADLEHAHRARGLLVVSLQGLLVHGGVV